MPRRRAERRATKKPMDVDALWAIKRVGTPTLSPDGRTACASVTSYDMDKNEASTELWLFPTGFETKGGVPKPRKLTAGDKDSDPRWSPDGARLAVSRVRCVADICGSDLFVAKLTNAGGLIWVKCLGVDEKGRVRLSRKAAMAERDQEMAEKK